MDQEEAKIRDEAAKADDDGSKPPKAKNDMLDYPTAGDDKISLGQNEGPQFESQDRADFLVAKVFSGMPESGFEIRIRI